MYSIGQNKHYVMQRYYSPNYTAQWWSNYAVARTQYAEQSSKIIIMIEVTHFVCACAYYIIINVARSKMVYSSYKQQRIMFFFSGLGYKSTSIARLLREEGLTVCRSAVVRFVKKYKETETICQSSWFLPPIQNHT